MCKNNLLNCFHNPSGGLKILFTTKRYWSFLNKWPTLGLGEKCAKQSLKYFAILHNKGSNQMLLGSGLKDSEVNLRRLILAKDKKI